MLMLCFLRYNFIRVPKRSNPEVIFGIYTTLPICSFTLKAKIPKKSQPIQKPTTLGEHIRRARLKRKQAQCEIAKLLQINQMYLSSWELNQKAPHPKYVDEIVNYLGYT